MKVNTTPSQFEKVPKRFQAIIVLAIWANYLKNLELAKNALMSSSIAPLFFSPNLPREECQMLGDKEDCTHE